MNHTEFLAQSADTKTRREQKLAQIAAEYLFIETLEVRNRDRLDFHDVHVANLKSALHAAYEAGLVAALSIQR